jgi:hypothetical protein
MKNIQIIGIVSSLVLIGCGGGSSSSDGLSTATTQSSETQSANNANTQTTTQSGTNSDDNSNDSTTSNDDTSTTDNSSSSNTSSTTTGSDTTSSSESNTEDTTNTNDSTTSSESSQTPSQTTTYRIVDTNQEKCYNSSGSEVSCNGSGQDGAYVNNAPSYTDNQDGTVSDNVTSLVWQQSPDTNGDGSIDADDKLSQSDAVSYCENLTLGGQSDWRLPDIKTLYSLMDFSGEDPSSYEGSDTSSLVPFIDDSIFAFGYGDTSANERIIDAQWATTTIYVYRVMSGSEAMFGLNLADGRIKGYPTSNKSYYVQCVRGNESYGKNSFVDNGDETISDSATNLMWQKSDNAESINWESAIGYCESLTLAGKSDWRLPNAKELQSILDYTRSPDTTSSAAIDAKFNATSITNEEGVSDYGFYWSSTTHKNMQNGSNAAYVSFGRALGYMNSAWLDVHGAGAQRSDPKDVDALDTNQGGYTIVDGAITHGPQGDVVRGLNLVRCVRDID